MLWLSDARTFLPTHADGSLRINPCIAGHRIKQQNIQLTFFSSSPLPHKIISFSTISNTNTEVISKGANLKHCNKHILKVGDPHQRVLRHNTRSSRPDFSSRYRSRTASTTVEFCQPSHDFVVFRAHPLELDICRCALLLFNLYNGSNGIPDNSSGQISERVTASSPDLASIGAVSKVRPGIVTQWFELKQTTNYNTKHYTTSKLRVRTNKTQ